MHKNWYPLFDVYRIFFAMLVVARHVSDFTDLGWYLSAIHPVAAFVCLSGFLIPRALKRSASYGRFAWNRGCRVLPAFIASLLLVYALPGWGVNAVGASLITYATLALIYPSFALSNGPLWSLALEEILYGFHALLHRAKWIPWLMMALCLLWSITHTWSQLTNIVFISSCFFLGNLLERYERKVSAWFWVAAIIAVLASKGLLGIIGDALLSGIDPGLGGQFSWLASTILLCICLIGLGVSWRPNIKIPDLSYGVYIYHYPIMYWGLNQAGWEIWQIVAATIALSAGSWYLLEAPALRLKNRSWRPTIRSQYLLNEANIQSDRNS